MSDSPLAPPHLSAEDSKTLPASSLYRLCEEIIGLRETNARQHKLFEQSLTRSRDELQTTFNQFAADTHKAYQQLREQIQGEKRTSLRLLNELLDIGKELEHIVAARPAANDADALAKWSESVAVEARKVMESARQHGIQRYEAVIGSAYNPALHERVGSKRVEGMDAYRVAEQVEPGYASLQPEFVLRRAKVIVTE
jgi:molecular chaperone GrpE (heat shock protein)